MIRHNQKVPEDVTFIREKTYTLPITLESGSGKTEWNWENRKFAERGLFRVRRDLRAEVVLVVGVRAHP